MLKKLLTFLMVLSVFTACQNAPKNKTFAKDGVLVVAMDLNFPPFEGVNEKGEPYGISVEMASALAQSLGRTVEIQNVRWDGLLPGLRSGAYDIVLSTMSVTPEREEIVNFSVPYGSQGLSILARKDFVLNNPQELNNKDITIAVRKGTLGETVAMRDYADATIISLDNFDTAMLEVVQGRADVALADPLTVYEKNQDNMETTIAIYTSISPLPLAIAIRKDNTQLKTDIDESLGRFIAEGKMNELTDRYLKDIKQQFADQNMPFFLF